MKDLHTNVFNITKEKQGPKVSAQIMPVLNVDPNEQYRTNTEQYGEPTQEEQEQHQHSEIMRRPDTHNFLIGE